MSRKEWLIAAVLTFITILAWLAFNTMHARSKVEISPKVQELIEPISPDFNTQSLSQP